MHTPHRKNTKQLVKSWIIGFLFAIFLIWLTACNPCKSGRGCRQTRGMSGYGQAGFGKPLCPIRGCSFFYDFANPNSSEILACYRHSIDDYKESDSVIWLPYKKQMLFGY